MITVPQLIKDYSQNKWIYIIIDGLDATGKTYFIDKLRENLSRNNIHCINVKQPWSEIVGEYLTTTPKDNRNPSELAALFYADAILLNSWLKYLLNKSEYGGIILQDRHVINSSIAYQIPHIKNENMRNGYLEMLVSKNWEIGDLSLSFITANNRFLEREEMFESDVLDTASHVYKHMSENEHIYGVKNYPIDLTDTQTAIKYLYDKILENIKP
jgi:thymidylate kinase